MMLSHSVIRGQNRRACNSSWVRKADTRSNIVTWCGEEASPENRELKCTPFSFMLFLWNSLAFRVWAFLWVRPTERKQQKKSEEIKGWACGAQENLLLDLFLLIIRAFNRIAINIMFFLCLIITWLISLFECWNLLLNKPKYSETKTLIIHTCGLFLLKVPDGIHLSIHFSLRTLHRTLVHSSVFRKRTEQVLMPE